MISKNKIKYIRSLKSKKFRNEYRQFFAEGDKIIRDVIEYKPSLVKEIIATTEWLSANKEKLSNISNSIITETGIRDYEQISALETPPGVMALFDIKESNTEPEPAAGELSIILDSIQDPGNMGTIIRTASWFGIGQIFCSEDSADCYNPKVVQSAMGGVFSVEISYCSLRDLLSRTVKREEIAVYGTFIGSKRIWDEKLDKSAVIVFGNESRGISEDLMQYIKIRLTIPAYITKSSGITDSLNVASAAAIVCSAFRR